MSKSKGVRLNSGLGRAAAEYSNKCGPTKSYTAAFGDGALHLVEVAEKWALEHGAGDIGSKFGSKYDYADLRDYLKSYCGRE